MDDKLFGTEEFSHLATEPEKDSNSIPEKLDDQAPEKITQPYGENVFSSNSKGNIKNQQFKFSRKFVIGGIFLLLGICIVIALVSIHVNTKKNIISYKLSAQTRLMRRLSKKKAAFELEYSYLKSKQVIESKLKDSNWQEVAPEEIKYIKIREDYKTP